MGSLLYIYRSHLGFGLVGWVGEVAFLLLFAINNTPVSTAGDFLGCWVHQVHLHFTGPGALIDSLIVSV